MVISNMCVFLQRSIHHRTVVASSSVVMLGVTPYKLFLKVPWANKQVASSNNCLQDEKIGSWWEIRQIVKLG
jgi:hypothetical protein